MITELDKKEELICKIKKLSAFEIYMLKSFMAGMEAEQSVKNCDKNCNSPEKIK